LHFGVISHDNALAETVNGYYKAELVRGPDQPGPWKNIEELELATLGWVHWPNQERLHGFIGNIQNLVLHTKTCQGFCCFGIWLTIAAWVA
jgi:transposase InsO family protein